MRTSFRCLTSWLGLLLLLSGSTGQSAMADEPLDPQGAKPAARSSWEFPKLKLAVKTMGGRQFWGDRIFFRGWRIQHNTLFNQHRLLDSQDYRHASGTLEECVAALEEIKRENQLKPMSGRAVIFLHGIIRSSKSFSAMMKAFEEEGDLVVPFDYPSTQVNLALSAAYLNDVLSSLEGVEEIDLICHSMGGLIVRKYLEDYNDPRIKRMIMIGTPNSGSEMANLLKTNVLYKAIMGPAGQDLIVDENGTIANLPIPKFEFAIVAGAKGDTQGFNPVLPGDDDGTVSVESAKLAGATDFMTSSSLHSFLMQDKEVIQSCQRYINTGAFRESGERKPIQGAPEN